MSDVHALRLTPSAALAKDGYVILRGAADEKTIAGITRDLAPAFDETPFCEGSFYGQRTKRFGRLLTRSAHAAQLVEQAEVFRIASDTLAPWCDTIQLNLTQAIEIHPGALAQFPHRDQDMWNGIKGEVEYLVNVMWPLTPFTAENGATVFWPGSHGSCALQPGVPAERRIATAAPGDAIIFLGSTLHGAGENVSGLPRRSIIVSYCLGWLKPYENQWLAYPPAVARNFPAELAALVGYRQHRPNLGNFEGQCPSVLLRDGSLSVLNAVDALRPDQQTMLDAYVARQKSARGVEDAGET
jgi:ectoine hydroxylase-related dioxygenase (phytanoyl-CoA dioxygenase family)